MLQQFEVNDPYSSGLLFGLSLGLVPPHAVTFSSVRASAIEMPLVGAVFEWVDCLRCGEIFIDHFIANLQLRLLNVLVKEI